MSESPWVLAIVYVNGSLLLQRAVASVEPLWSRTIIVDNSYEGLKQSQWPVAVSRPPVPLTFTQSHCWLASMAVANHHGRTERR